VAEAAAAPARRTVVGTAGHIDHGKTALVRALTGIDCDRWQEEKERGITIDLGFAWLREGDLQVGFVDVPGHQKFLHNALAGLGGIGLVLLVVAADEGVKPQTREHLDICRLLGIPRALVALTKIDLVSEDLVELAELEVAELLAGTPYAEAPRFAVSSVTGEGVEELKAALLAAAAEAADTAAREPPAGLAAAGRRDEAPARLPIDRAFHLKGLGVLVTGTLASGTVRPGDTLELLPPGTAARVRSIQVHGRPREEARAGERTSLQLTGVALDQVERGMELVAPGRFALARRLAARFTLLPDSPKPLSGFVPVRVHHFAAEVMGRMRPLGGDEIAPGGEGLVELRLDAPLVAVRGDRFIVRRPSPPATLGGGTLLDPAYRRDRRAGALAALGGGLDEVLALWVERAGEAGAGEEELARRLGAEPGPVAGRLAALVREGRLLEAPAGAGHGRRFVAPAAFRRIAVRAGRVLADYFQRQRLARGMPKAEAVERILPGRAAELSDVYLAWLAAQQVLSVAGDQVNLPGREAELTGRESELSRSLLAAVEQGGLTPPAPAELAVRLGAKPQIVDGLVRYLVERGELLRLPDGLVVSAAAAGGLRAELAASGWERFTVADFKDRFGLSRKWAIPWLEHLDSSGATRRLGDQRQVVR
jgi:selenocysteine-specific elongation factor